MRVILFLANLVLLLGILGIGWFVIWCVTGVIRSRKVVTKGFIALVMAAIALSATACGQVPYSVATALAEQKGTVLWDYSDGKSPYIFGVCGEANTVIIVEVSGTPKEPVVSVVVDGTRTKSSCGNRHDFWVRYDHAVVKPWRKEYVENAMTTLERVVAER